jgi:hypothetical protein
VIRFVFVATSHGVGMKINRNRWVLACLTLAVMATPAVFAQQQPSSSDPYQGVSQPPPDDTIVATPDTPPDTPPPPKPSPAIVATAAAPRPSAAPPAPSDPDSRYDNTDYGIVTVPVSGNAQSDQNYSDSSNDGAVLHTREGSDYGIVSATTGSANELPEGTEIRVRLADALSTTDTTVDTPFHGRVLVDVMKGGSVIIPAGSTLRGRVVQVTQGHHFGSPATLRLRPDVVILPDGTAYHLYAQVLDSEAPGTRTGSEGGIEPTSHVVKKTAEYGVGVGAGALVGGELAGPPGLLAGSLVGAGLVTTHLFLQHPEAAVVPTGSEIIFSLTEPMDLTPTRN